jgi:hypothetical protein
LFRGSTVSNFDERLPSGAAFLGVAEAFDAVQVKDLLYKLTVLNFPSYVVKTISSYIDSRTFRTSLQSATSTCRVVRAGVAQGELVSPVLFSLYLNDILIPSRHVDIAQYVLVATSRCPSQPASYLYAYLGRLELWLGDWRIAINVSKSTTVFHVKVATRSQKPRPVQFLGVPIQWVETAHLELNLDRRLAWSLHNSKVKKKAAQRLGVLGPPPLKNKAVCPSETARYSTSSSSVL